MELNFVRPLDKILSYLPAYFSAMLLYFEVLENVEGNANV